MPTGFPAALDDFVSPTAADPKNSATVPHANQHANANDAIEAIEAKVGVDGSAVTTSLDYLAKIALPKGVLTPPAIVTANQASITAETDLTGVTVAPTVGTNRRIKVTCEITVGATVTGDTATLRIREGATLLIEREGVVTAGRGLELIATAWLTPTAGVHTYKATLQRVIGTGTLSAASVAGPSIMAAEDMGKV